MDFVFEEKTRTLELVNIICIFSISLHIIFKIGILKS